MYDFGSRERYVTHQNMLPEKKFACLPNQTIYHSDKRFALSPMQFNACAPNKHFREFPNYEKIISNEQIRYSPFLSNNIYQGEHSRIYSDLRLDFNTPLNSRVPSVRRDTNDPTIPSSVRRSEEIRLSSPSSDGRLSTFSTTSSNDSRFSPSIHSPVPHKFIPSPAPSDETEDESDEYLDVESFDDDEEIRHCEKKDKQEFEVIGDETLVKKEKSKNSNRNKLWKFLLKLLEEDKEEHYIRWTNKQQGEFRMIKTAAVAALWGRSNNRKNMTYEKMTRAMRYYYKMKVIKKVPHKNLHYQFGPSVMAKVVFNNETSRKTIKPMNNSIHMGNQQPGNKNANFIKDSVNNASLTSSQYITNPSIQGQTTNYHKSFFGQQQKTRIFFPSQFRNPFL